LKSSRRDQRKRIEGCKGEGGEQSYGQKWGLGGRIKKAPPPGEKDYGFGKGGEERRQKKTQLEFCQEKMLFQNAKTGEAVAPLRGGSPIRGNIGGMKGEKKESWHSFRNIGQRGSKTQRGEGQNKFRRLRTNVGGK